MYCYAVFYHVTPVTDNGIGSYGNILNHFSNCVYLCQNRHRANPLGFRLLEKWSHSSRQTAKKMAVKKNGGHCNEEDTRFPRWWAVGGKLWRRHGRDLWRPARELSWSAGPLHHSHSGSTVTESCHSVRILQFAIIQGTKSRVTLPLTVCETTSILYTIRCKASCQWRNDRTFYI